MSSFLIILAAVLLVLAGVLLWRASRAREETGLPAGRIISSDTDRWQPVERPLYDPETGLTGRPDYLVQQGNLFIPVEVKSNLAPPQPYDGHIYQLAAYCYLVELSHGVRPPYGILHYRNRTYAIDYTPALREELLSLLREMHAMERQGECERSHSEPARCARCGYRDLCDQRL